MPLQPACLANRVANDPKLRVIRIGRPVALFPAFPGNRFDCLDGFCHALGNNLPLEFIRYNPYVNMLTPETFRASSVLAAGNGYCVGKAALYAAACRVHGIPARVGFADVRNHLTTEKLRQSMGTDVFTWHGFTEVYVDGAWRKATPTFNATLCAKVGVHPLDFDGHNDALLHPFDGAGRTYMQYVNDHGSYHDVPAKFLMREMARDYANMQGEDLSGRDMEREAAKG